MVPTRPALGHYGKKAPPTKHLDSISFGTFLNYDITRASRKTAELGLTFSYGMKTKKLRGTPLMETTQIPKVKQCNKLNFQNCCRRRLKCLPASCKYL